MSASIRLRAMRAEEYASYADERDADYAASLRGVLPADAAEQKAKEDRARYLPEGHATPGHRFFVAEGSDGEILGRAWLGLAEPGTGASEVAWLYDIVVEPPHRRTGVGRAMLAGIEAAARDAGAERLGLNVFAANTAAVALYAACSYEVTTQQMAKSLVEPPPGG